MNLAQIQEKEDEIQSSYRRIEREQEELRQQAGEIRQDHSSIARELEDSQKDEKELEVFIETKQKELEEWKAEETEKNHVLERSVWKNHLWSSRTISFRKISAVWKMRLKHTTGSPKKSLKIFPEVPKKYIKKRTVLKNSKKLLPNVQVRKRFWMPDVSNGRKKRKNAVPATSLFSLQPHT